MTFLDFAGEVARWEVVVTLTLGVFGIVGVVGRITWKVFQFMDRQIDAIDANTQAVDNLSQRILKLELVQTQTVRKLENGEA